MFSPQLWQPPVISADALQQLSTFKTALEERLTDIASRYRDVRLASSLAIEDMVITDVIDRLRLPIKVFTLDTAKLHAETLSLLEATQQRYPKLTIEQYTPASAEVLEFEAEVGMSAIYDSLEHRKRCCSIRKVRPLNQALAGADAWLTGQRREQSATREQLAFEEQDTARGIAKFNPLYDWEEAVLWVYAQQHEIPLNALYQQGYPSIGCEPCTRPIKLGEEIRQGRWWWEQQASKECGLHPN